MGPGLKVGCFRVPFLEWNLPVRKESAEEGDEMDLGGGGEVTAVSWRFDVALKRQRTLPLLKVGRQCLETLKRDTQFTCSGTS